MTCLSPKHKQFASPGCFGQLIEPIQELLKGQGADNFNYHARKITFEPYFRAMVLFSLSSTQTLRGLQKSMGKDPLYQMHGAKIEVSVPGLSQANAARPMDSLCEILASVMAAIHQLPGESKVLRELNGQTLSSIANLLTRTQIFDATSLHLPTRIAKWASWGPNNQGGAKVHLKIAGGYGGLEKVVISPSRDNDRKYFEALLEVKEGAGAIYLFDSGYYNIETFDTITESGNYLVSKLGSRMTYTVLSEEDLGDTVAPCGYHIHRRRVVRLGINKYYRVSRQEYVLLDVTDTRGKKGTLVSNMLDLESEKICALFMYKWCVETCFRWLKHTLGLSKFVSYSPRGVMMQILIALITYGLLVLYHNGRRRFGLISLLTELELELHQALYEYGYQQGILAAEQAHRGLKGGKGDPMV